MPCHFAWSAASVNLGSRACRSTAAHSRRFLGENPGPATVAKVLIPVRRPSSRKQKSNAQGCSRVEKLAFAVPD